MKTVTDISFRRLKIYYFLLFCCRLKGLPDRDISLDSIFLALPWRVKWNRLGGGYNREGSKVVQDS